MAWREDEARKRFFEVTLTLKDIYGQDWLTDLYEQELQRELVMRNHDANNQAILAATSAAQVFAHNLDIATKALEFYAEGDNHKARPNGVSAVAKDKGRRARHALEAINAEAGEDNSDDEGEAE